jgi:molybdopterin molybdotransferase
LPEFFHVVEPSVVFSLLASFGRTGIEHVGLEEALDRVLAQEVRAEEDLPYGPRATMDGYAVRAADTFGSTENSPTLLALAGRVEMGKLPGFALSSGQACEIPTGGFLPDGADAVVMIEYADRLSERAIEVRRPVTAGENVLGKGGDVVAGKVVLGPGRRLRPHDLGLLAGLGVCQVAVHQRPKVFLVSTGDEIVPANQKPAPGQVRDINRYSISALVTRAGAEVTGFRLVQDIADKLGRALEEGLGSSDAVVLSGGSSVGERDTLVEAVGRFAGAELLAHGIAISPGKPTLLARIAGKPVFGLPGHPVSAMIVAQVFLVPFLRFLQGEALLPGPEGTKREAILATSVPSVSGRQEFVRVRLEEQNGTLYARPVFGRSSMLSSMVDADGLIVVPTHTEGLARGTKVEVTLF